MRFSRAVVAAFLVFGSASGQAAERFVSLSGNDANAGTLSAPYRTINKASSAALPGDVISVRGGVYNAAVTIAAKGMAAARITFRPYPGEKVILDGVGIGASTILVNLYRTEYVDFTGFEVRNAPYIAVNARNTKSTRVANNDIHHSFRNAIYFGADAMAGSTGALIENNSVHDNVQENVAHAMAGGWAGSVVVSRTAGGTVSGNRIFHNDGEGVVAVLSDNVSIRGNEIFDNFAPGIFLDNARFAVVASNFVYATGNTRYFRDGFPGMGIVVANEAYTDTNPGTDNRIYNNIVAGTRWGFYYGNFENGGGLRNTVVASNTIYGTAQEPIRITLDAHANSVVENNVVHSGGMSPTYAGGGVTFRSNNWYGVNPGPAAGTGDVYGNPALANPGAVSASGYKLTPGSAAIAGASASALVTADFFGTMRVAPFDIGAHQFSGGPAADTQAPSAPGNLRPASSSISIALAWDAAQDNVAVTAYQVVRDGAAVATLTSTSWNDGTAAPGVLYAYQLFAIDAAGNRSSGSNVLQAAWEETAGGTDTESPTTPLHLAVTAVTSSAVSMAWDASTDDTGVVLYRIYQNGVPIATTTSTAFTASSLSAHTGYAYSVVAEDAAGNTSAASNTVSTMTLKARRRRS